MKKILMLLNYTNKLRTPNTYSASNIAQLFTTLYAFLFYLSESLSPNAFLNAIILDISFNYFFL